MSTPDGPATTPEQPEPAQPAPDQSAPVQPAAQPAAAQPAAPLPAQAASPVPPAPRRGAGFTVLVAAVTALVVALVVSAGTAFAVARHTDHRSHRVVVGVERSEGCRPDGAQRSDRPGWGSDQRRDPGADGQDERGSGDGQSRRSLPGGPSTTEQDESAGPEESPAP